MLFRDRQTDRRLFRSTVVHMLSAKPRDGKPKLHHAKLGCFPGQMSLLTLFENPALSGTASIWMRLTNPPEPLNSRAGSARFGIRRSILHAILQKRQILPFRGFSLDWILISTSYLTGLGLDGFDFSPKFQDLIYPTWTRSTKEIWSSKGSCHAHCLSSTSI